LKETATTALTTKYRALTPTQTEQPFRTTQLVVLALFVVLVIAAAIRFRIEPIRAI
jgi:hypothetical protein